MDRDQLDGYECRTCGRPPADERELQRGTCRDCAESRRAAAAQTPTKPPTSEAFPNGNKFGAPHEPPGEYL